MGQHFINPAVMPDRYAMQVTGDCLDPAVRDGEYLAFSATADCAPGDVVAVFLAPEACRNGMPQVQVKILVTPLPRWRNARWTGPQPVVGFEMLNPATRFSVPVSDILAVHLCISPVREVRRRGGTVSIPMLTHGQMNRQLAGGRA